MSTLVSLTVILTHTLPAIMLTCDLQWALIELSRNPDIQIKLRNELLKHGSDPTYDQLGNGLPYLDAVVHEILRLHAPVRETTRMVRLPSSTSSLVLIHDSPYNL
jgi:hypothetical protein